VDRLWALWQDNMLAAHPGTHEDHYPPAEDLDPWLGDPLPRGHGINDPATVDRHSLGGSQ